MLADQAAPIRDPASARRMLAVAIALAVLVPLLVVGQFKPWSLFDASSLAALRRFVLGFFPPQVSIAFLVETAHAAWITVAIATTGLVLGLAFAIPAALVATRQLSVSAIGRDRMDGVPRIARWVVRAVLVAVRSLPEVVLALLFVRVVGLGPTAGVLAIAIAYGAMLAKVFCDIVESNDGAAAAALLANGGGRLAAFVYGTLPTCAAELSSYLIYRWECAVRASVVMGFVGAGGLGQATDTAMKMMAGDEVATLLLTFMLLVWIADLASAFVRRRLDVGGVRVVACAPSATTEGRMRVDRRDRRFGSGAVIVLLALVAASFVTLDLPLGALFGRDAVVSLAAFMADFFPIDGSSRHLARIAVGASETIAMSLVGTLIAAILGAAIALPASRHGSIARRIARLVLNLLRAVPELVWAAMLVIAVGLGPFAGTLALAVHTTGVLGRLFADTLENLPPGPAAALRDNGAAPAAVFWYARLPQALPQFLSYSLYRLENNIRAATVLGVVGAGGLGQMLYYALSLFQLRQAATVIVAMIAIVLAVDALSHALRARLAH